MSNKQSDEPSIRRVLLEWSSTLGLHLKPNHTMLNFESDLQAHINSELKKLIERVENEAISKHLFKIEKPIGDDVYETTGTQEVLVIPLEALNKISKEIE